MHVSGLVVRVKPDKMDTVSRQLQLLPGIEVHGHSATGNLVVSAESAHQDDFSEQLSAIEALPSVLAVSLVYHEEDTPAHEQDSPEH